MDYAPRGRLRKISMEKAWATIEELARYENEGWNDPVASGEGSLDYENPNIKQLLGVIKCKVDTLMKEAISLMGISESVFGMTSNTMYHLPSEPSRQEEFKDLVMNFILDHEEKVRQLEEYMCVIRSDFMQLSLEVVGKLREEIRTEQNRTKKIKKITRYPDTEDLKPLNDHKFSKNLTKEFTTNPPSFEVYTQPVSYPDEVEEIIGIPMEVKPLDETQLEDLCLNTCNHNIPISSREILSFDESEPQPNPLPNYPSLDVSLGEERGPIKPHSSDSFRMKEVDSLTIHTPPLPHVASFHLKDLYCYYHPRINDPKKHYGFKPGRGLNSPIGPKEVENVRIKETHHLVHTIQQQIF
nr:hypothetical protein [Tanacetum cinerariifolium]